MFILLHCQVKEQTSKRLHPRWFMHRRLSHLPFQSLTNLLSLLILRCNVVYLNLIHFELNHLSKEYWNLSYFFYTWQIIEFLCTAKWPGSSKMTVVVILVFSDVQRNLSERYLPSHVLRWEFHNCILSAYWKQLSYSSSHLFCTAVLSLKTGTEWHWFSIFPCFVTKIAKLTNIQASEAA